MKALLLCIASVGLFSGCLRREGLNAACQWPHETETHLDLQNTLDRQHLRGDAQFAEELAIRYSDPLRRREGLTEARRGRVQCMQTLFTKIAALHGVKADDVIHSASQRDGRADFLF